MGLLVWTVLAICWTVLLIVLKQAKINGIYFWVGSIGLFLLGGFILQRLYLFNRITIHNFLQRAFSFSKFWLPNGYNIMQHLMFSKSQSRFFEYECSGFLESLAYISIMAFYPLFKIPEKISLSIVGVLLIELFNLIRLTEVMLVLNCIGQHSFFISYAIIGRLLYYCLVICLFYEIFTKKQILRGKV